MRKIIILALIFVISYSSISEAFESDWLYLGNLMLNSDDYIDKNSIKVTGATIKYWERNYDHSKSHYLGNEEGFKKAIERDELLKLDYLSENEFNYIDLQHRTLTRIHNYDEGKVVNVFSSPDEKFQDINLATEREAATALAAYLGTQVLSWEKIKETEDKEVYLSDLIDKQRKLLWGCIKRKASPDKPTFSLLQYQDDKLTVIYDLIYLESHFKFQSENKVSCYYYITKHASLK